MKTIIIPSIEFKENNIIPIGTTFFSKTFLMGNWWYVPQIVIWDQIATDPILPKIVFTWSPALPSPKMPLTAVNGGKINVVHQHKDSRNLFKKIDNQHHGSKISNWKTFENRKPSSYSRKREKKRRREKYEEGRKTERENRREGNWNTIFTSDHFSFILKTHFFIPLKSNQWPSQNYNGASAL